MIEVQIKDSIYEAFDSIKLNRSMRDRASDISLKLIKKGTENIELGDVITLKYDNKKIFKGYIFKISENENDLIEILAFDSLRYLKNTHTMSIKNKTASQLIKDICSEFNLSVGEIVDTSIDIAVSQKIVENKSLFEIIYEAIDLTMLENKKNGRVISYVLYDDYGKITLKDQKNLNSDLILTKENIIKYSNNHSIDENTYNKILIYYKDDEEKVVNKYIVQDSNTQRKWGVLQKSYGVSKITKSQADEWGQKLLKYFNSPKWEFQITTLAMDLEIRGGTNIIINLETSNKTINKKLIVNEVSHIFNNKEYKMELKLLGVL